ncbi:MAG: hypothetical protein J6333_02785, partial [Planctomycetes bacterium]|nr:hypothetical protein [Planctomycetota bacterium]
MMKAPRDGPGARAALARPGHYPRTGGFYNLPPRKGAAPTRPPRHAKTIDRLGGHAMKLRQLAAAAALPAPAGAADPEITA